MGTQMEACQQESARAFSRLWRPYPVVLFSRFLWYLKAAGPAGAVRKTAQFAAVKIADVLGFRTQSRRSSAPALREEALDLQPGEWVQVKSESEIRETLDGEGKMRGLAFLDGMWPYCGRRLRVFKQVRTIFLEESRQVRRMKNTVLLEGVMCQGPGIACDRSCFFYWREAWLKRIAAGDV